MKNRETAAILMALTFSAAMMTSCGAYGSMEPASVYGAIETMETEPVEVYGGPETMATEFVYDESIPLPEQYNTWEESMIQRNGYDEATNSELEYDGIIFGIPDYMQEEENDEDDTVSYLAEESDTDFASLTIRHETRDITSGDGDFMQILYLIEDETYDDEHTVDYINQTAADSEIWMVTSFENINGENVITYNAYFIYPIDDDQADLVTVTLKMTSGCEYSYRDDFNQIILNAKLK